MGRTVGIDLRNDELRRRGNGRGEPTVIATAEGSRTLPSVVAFKQSGGERLVGVTAKRQSVVNPENTIYSIKRFMGHRMEEVQDEVSRVGYKVKAGKNGQVVRGLGRTGFRAPGARPLSMTIVLDSDGLTMLAHTARLEELRRRGEWPAAAPTVVLAESPRATTVVTTTRTAVRARAISGQSTGPWPDRQLFGVPR